MLIFFFNYFVFQTSGCTCQCNVGGGGGGGELVTSSPNRQTAEDYNTSVTSTTSSHYFTPLSSFLDESSNSSSSKQPDSLEYQNGQPLSLLIAIPSNLIFIRDHSNKETKRMTCLVIHCSGLIGLIELN